MSESIFPFSCPLQFSQSVQLSGELHQRVTLLWDRLHQNDHYALEQVFREAAYEWPGDTEGRILLAWVLLGNVLQKRSPNLDAFWKIWQQRVNLQGYFGKVYLPQLIDEQQLSSHGWVLRSLAELYLATGNPQVAEAGRNILQHLVLPLQGHYQDYPVLEAVRNAAGAASGSRDRQVGLWQLSTDIGCAFILTDGVVQAARLFGVDCEALLQEMVEQFARIPLLEVKAQTHATLTMTRALLRHYEATHEPRLLQLAQKNYELYRTCGMTEHYANDNWFGRPEWTEPCAIVDSFQCAMQLARLTHDDTILDDAHRIWFSAFLHAQRNNGGFGLDSCPHGDGNVVLRAVAPEAYWCCTMRAAEGFYEGTLHNLYRCGDTIRIPLPISGRFQFADGLVIEIQTSYPQASGGTFQILQRGATPITRVEGFFVDRGWLPLPAPEGAYALSERPAKYGTGKTLWQGPVLTGTDSTGKQHSVGENWQAAELQPATELKVVTFK